MTTNYNDLCRLCAKRNEFSKDLLDKNNKNMLDLVHQYMQISINENDNLPTKVCLDCEEKMVSFQLYILQCYKVQDYLSEICLENKLNVEDGQFGMDVIKSEVKNELNADDIFTYNTINEDSVAELGVDDFENDACNDINNSDIDDITIASLKQSEVRQGHEITEEAVLEFKRVLSKPNLDITDIIKLECTHCATSFKSWADLCTHYAEAHDTTPIVQCLCGYSIDSTSALKKHYTWHKKMNNEMRLFNRIDGDQEASGNEDTNVSNEGDGEDNLNLTSLQPIKEERELTKEEKAIIHNPTFKLKDVIRLKCSFCEKSFKSWSFLSSHYADIHKSSPRATCLCGYIIRSTLELHKHVADHRKKALKDSSKEKSTKRKKYDAELQAKMDRRVKDYIQFTCNICDREYSSWYKLQSHTERVHRVLPEVLCMSCGLSIKSKSVMYKHVQDHNNPTELSCDQCSLRAKSLEALNKHKLRHVPKSDRKFECTKCKKVFANKDALKSHEKSHIPIEERKVYQCDKCELRFTSNSAVSSHKRTVHEKIKSYVCDNCGYACGTGGELRQHVAIHSDERPFVCKTCSKRFKTYANLKTHEDTHGETAYPCYICNRVLNSRRTLRKHLLVHDDKCRHVCTYCNKAFKRRQTLKVHMFTHTGDKPLMCKWCDERFSYASTLRSHRLRCHPDKMAASDGGNAFRSVIQNWCDERFSYASTLRSHRLRCHPDKMAASDGGNAFRSVIQNPYAKDDHAVLNVESNES